MSINNVNTDRINTNRILALSGGGVKGVAELVVLVEIEKRTGKSISELFPIIAGTSVGGLIGALLTIPKEENSKIPKYSAQETLDIFTDNLPKIFPNIFLGSLKQIFTHKYNSIPLEKVLEKYLGNNRLNATTSCLIIPATDLNANDHQIKVFNSKDRYSQHIKIKDILSATTAAPTYFKPITNNEHIKGYSKPQEVSYAYADGGLCANRPAIEVLKILKKEQNENKNILCSINFDIDMEANTSIPETGFEGTLRWLIQGKLVDRLMQTNEDLATEAVNLALGKEDEFIRIFLPIDKKTTSLDNASPENIAALIAIGAKYIEEHGELLQKLCDDLMNDFNKEQKLNTTKKPSEISEDEGFENEEENTESVQEDVVDGRVQYYDQDDGYESADELVNNYSQKVSVNKKDTSQKDGVDGADDYSAKQQILIIIRKAAEEFHQQFPDLKVDKFLNGLNNYTYAELQKLVIKFCELEKLSENEVNQFVNKFNILEIFNSEDLLNLISDFSNVSNDIPQKYTIFSSCSTEAEELTLEGIDNIPVEEVY